MDYEIKKFSLAENGKMEDSPNGSTGEASVGEDGSCAQIRLQRPSTGSTNYFEAKRKEVVGSLLTVAGGVRKAVEEGRGYSDRL